MAWDSRRVTHDDVARPLSLASLQELSSIISGTLVSRKKKRAPFAAKAVGISSPITVDDLAVDWRYVMAVLIGALAIRLLYVYQVRSDVLSKHLVIDAKFYDDWAQRITHGDWLGSTVYYQDPLYAYFLAAIYKLFGHSLDAVRCIQAVIDTFTVGLVYVLGRRLFSPLAGLVSACMMALLGPMVYYIGILDKTTFSVFMIAGALALMGEALAREGLLLYAASGCMFGLASLSRGNMIIAAAATVPWLLLNPRVAVAFEARLRRSLLFALATAAVVGTVALRNYIVGHDMVLITANPGLNFFIGNNPYTIGQYIEPPFIRGVPEDEYDDAKAAAELFAKRKFEKPSEVSRYWFSQGFKFISENPEQWAGLTARKLFLTLNEFEIAETYSYYYFREKYTALALPFLTYGLIVSLGLAGLFFRLYEEGPNLLHLFTSVYLASLLAFFVTSRYRFPLVVALAPFAGWLLLEAWRARNSAARVIPVAVVSVAIFGFSQWHPQWVKFRVLQPTLSTSHTIAGYIYSDLGDFENSKRELEAAVRANPDAAINYVYLGGLYMNRGDARAALANYEKALRFNPQMDAAWEQIGIILYNAKDYRGAAGAFNNALSIRPYEPLYKKNFEAVKGFLPAKK